MAVFVCRLYPKRIDDVITHMELDDVSRVISRVGINALEIISIEC